MRKKKNTLPQSTEKHRTSIFYKNETYSVQSGQLLSHFPHGEVHKVVFVFILSGHLGFIYLLQ